MEDIDAYCAGTSCAPALGHPFGEDPAWTDPSLARACLRCGVQQAGHRWCTSVGHMSSRGRAHKCSAPALTCA